MKEFCVYLTAEIFRDDESCITASASYRGLSPFLLAPPPFLNIETVVNTEGVVIADYYHR